jgi:hypothetical protein
MCSSLVLYRQERKMATLQCYGENSFTFLFFQAISHDNRVREILLPNLLRFEDGEKFAEQVGVEEETDIWLFPNFGRKYGFGEPDALLLVDNLSFWFEVETRLDFQTGLPALKQSLLQLARFHFFHQALASGSKTRRVGVPHEAILGPTISDDWSVKQAVLKCKGHPVLQAIRERLKSSVPHYVLLYEGRPTGPGGDVNFNAAMFGALQQVSGELNVTFRSWADSTGEEIDRIPKMLPKDRCWYAYWNGDLDHRFNQSGVSDPLEAGGYVRIGG